MQLTILMVAGFTCLAAFMSDFWSLALVRFLQGLGYGGEAAVGGVLISGVIRPALRGRVAASVQSSYAVGYAISVSLPPVIASLFSEEMGWRVFFAIGIIPAALVFFIRRLVPESGIYAEARASQRDGAVPPPFWTTFTGRHLRRTAAAAIMSTGIFGGAKVMITWLPTYLRSALGLSIKSSTGFLVMNILGSLVGPLLFGWLSDRIGRRPAFMTFLVLQSGNVAILLLAPIGLTTTIVLSFFLGAFSGLGHAADLRGAVPDLDPGGRPGLLPRGRSWLWLGRARHGGHPGREPAARDGDGNLRPRLRDRLLRGAAHARDRRH